MSTSLDLLRRKVFSDEEIKNADTIDRLRMHLIDPDNVDLNAEDQSRLNTLNIVYNTLCQHPRQEIVIRKLKILLDLQHSTIIKYISDAQQLYSNIVVRNTYFDKSMQRERLLRHLEFCDKTGRVKEMIEIEKLIAKIDSEMAVLKPEPLKSNKAQLPVFKLSMDPSVLAQASTIHVNKLTQEEE